MYNNILYFKKINKIGGTESFLWEIAKKYKDLDITIFFDEADYSQVKRLRQYVRCKKRKEGEIVECKRAFFNFNIDMIDDVESTENFYAFISHANYEELGYKPPIEHPKLTHFIGVSQLSTNKLDEWIQKLGLKAKTEKCYNPLTLEPKEKLIHLVSACRLDDQVKGGGRTQKLIEALDRYCDKTGRHYIWHIFSNTKRIENGVEVDLRDLINSPNVVIMQPRTDVRPYIADSSYVLQLSNDMETYCYTINEALGYGVPIVTTPLSILEELPITDNEHIVLDWNCENVDEVARQIFEKKVKKFNYEIPKDDWDKFLTNDKSTYSEELKDIVTVECIHKPRYYDLDLQKYVYFGEQLKMIKARADELMNQDLVKIIREE